MATDQRNPDGSLFTSDGSGTSDGGVEPGTFGQRDENIGRQGGINQGTDEELATSEEVAARRRHRQSLGDLVDDNAASHQGGMGAQSGQVDFGSAGNLAGGIADGSR